MWGIRWGCSALDAAGLLGHLVDMWPGLSLRFPSTCQTFSFSYSKSWPGSCAALWRRTPALSQITCISEAGDSEAGRQTQFPFVLRGSSHLGGSCLSHFIHVASSVLHNCQPGPAADVEITALYGLFNQLPQLHQGRFYHLLLISPKWFCLSHQILILVSFQTKKFPIQRKETQKLTIESTVFLNIIMMILISVLNSDTSTLWRSWDSISPEIL